MTTSFRSTTKKTRGTTDVHLGRRSQYIGVSRNNTNWQALINVKNSKKYIGTFTSEIEAARNYDIYAVAMQGEKALLNFNYTPQQMVDAVEYYLEHKKARF